MSRTRERMKGRKTTRGFSMLIHDYFTSAEYAALSAIAVKALIDLYCQFRGSNNGDLCAAWKTMAPRGWTSKGALEKALTELLDAGWIVVTRMGGNRVARLYAVTWLGIDRCDNKLDVGPQPVPGMDWKKPAGWKKPVRPMPTSLRRKAATAAISAPRSTGPSVPPHGSKEVAIAELCPAPRVSTLGLGVISAPRPTGPFLYLRHGRPGQTRRPAFAEYC